MLELCLALVTLAAPPEAVSFEVAVQRAVANHPAMRSAAADAARALALVEQSRAPSLPTLNASGTWTRLDSDRVRGEIVVASKNQLSANLQLTVPLISPARWTQWWRASKAADAAGATSADVKRQVALNAARAWLTVLGQKRVVEVATRARDTARAHLDFARQRRSGGVGNRLDEVRAAQELAVSEAQLQNGLSQLTRVQEALGLAAGAESALDTTADEPALGSAQALDAALTSATEDRLDVRAARARADAAASSSRAAWADYLPLLSVVATPFVQDPPSLTNPQMGWQAQAVLTLPLYEGGLRYGQAHEREAQASAAAAQLELVRRQARSDVRTTFEQLTHVDAALRATVDAAAQAHEALDLANLAYSTGVANSLEVLDAERRARDADTQRALAEDAARQARLDLLAASGRFP